MSQTTINIKDLAANGVSLTPSTDPGFAAQAGMLIGTQPADIAPILQYSVILKNLSGQTIRGYALRWSYLDQSGKRDANYQVEQNFDPRQSGAELSPGGASVLSPVGPIVPRATSVSGTARPVRPKDLSKLAKYTSITVSLDAVAFDNGIVIGPNEGFATNIWGAMYAAQRDIGLAAKQKIETSTRDEFIKWLSSKASQSETHPVGASIAERLGGSSHWYQMYARMTAEGLLHFTSQSAEVLSTEVHRLTATPVPILRR